MPPLLIADTIFSPLFAVIRRRHTVAADAATYYLPITLPLFSPPFHAADAARFFTARFRHYGAATPWH